MLPRVRIAAILFLGQALGRGAQAIYAVLMVRELSERDFGDFAYVLAIAGIVVMVGDLGLSRLIIRDTARAQDRAKLARELLRVRTIGVAGASLALALLGVTGGLPQGVLLAIAMSAYAAAEGLAYGYESAAIGIERPALFAYVQAVAGVAVLVAAIVVLSHDAVTAAGAAAGLAAASALKLAAHRVVWHRHGAAARSLSDLPVKRWLVDALPFLALAVLAAVFYRFGVVILHLIRGPSETAPFAAAMRVFDAVALLGGIGFAAVSPTISRIHEQSPAGVWVVWRKMIGRTACVAFPAAAALVVFSEPLANALFGARYRDSAGTALALLAPGMAFAVLQNLNAAVVFMSNERGRVVLLTFVNVVVLIGLVSVFTATDGSAGAAAATSCAELWAFATFSTLIYRRHAPYARMQGA